MDHFNNQITQNFSNQINILRNEVIIRFDNLESQLKVLSDNTMRRLKNARSIGESSLLPLFCEKQGNTNFGLLPPAGIFPANLDVVQKWTTLAPFDSLKEFYGEDFLGALVGDKRKSFLGFIGY